ncbi:hypothetical protein PF005_g32531 [Phytophthora fragariae]|uniref:Uncharacterized protein n=1 Tax=Phytophthora fragariae TaxID=53985 RepID=A0A6A4AUM1_9STRA|nr:hypothetical protein PF003_g22061 [Phytophthora fragariae]KAE9055500.1 hypothetical protein PF010_g32127 [Phytophthora fragariae]KAE9158234.1 hypothetical protein PF005_g32531 [Phytophthora fragariae]KAE9261518.1 hypothetical protein PF001_g32387 [Phytophthora fragariae]
MRLALAMGLLSAGTGWIRRSSSSDDSSPCLGPAALPPNHLHPTVVATLTCRLARGLPVSR